jgi:hypothetical protein
VARGVTEDQLALVNGSWTTPPEVTKLFGEVDRVVNF